MGSLAHKNQGKNISGAIPETSHIPEYAREYKVGGLIFDSEDDYQLLKNIDLNIKQTVELVEEGIIDMNEFFNKVKKINVKESYYDAAEEMDGLFENVIKLLCYEGTRFETDYKVGCCFFDKINIIEYDNDSDVEIRLPDSGSESESERDDDSDSD